MKNVSHKKKFQKQIKKIANNNYKINKTKEINMTKQK